MRTPRWARSRPLRRLPAAVGRPSTGPRRDPKRSPPASCHSGSGRPHPTGAPLPASTSAGAAYRQVHSCGDSYHSLPRLSSRELPMPFVCGTLRHAMEQSGGSEEREVRGMTIGEVLKQKRQEERLSLRQAALRIGVSPQAYTWWEKDQIVPEGRWAAALASWLGRSQEIGR